MFCGYRKPQNFAVFISGGGSTLQALLEQKHQIDIKVVISNRTKALGVVKAKKMGCPVEFINKATTEKQLNQILEKYKIDKIILAGYMKLLSATFVEKWKDKIINIHPSLLPKYPGLNSAETSWQEKDDMGVTLHIVNEHMDDGRIIMQQVSKQKENDLSLTESLLLLRRTEQHLLRQLTYSL